MTVGDIRSRRAGIRAAVTLPRVIVLMPPTSINQENPVATGPKMAAVGGSAPGHGEAQYIWS
jgi:hypothetical protein